MIVFGLSFLKIHISLKVICQEKLKTVNFLCSDKRYRENHIAENRHKKLMSIQKLCQFI